MKKKNWFKILTLGLGGLVFWLFGTKSGKETRKYLEEIGQKVIKKIMKEVKEVKELTQAKYEEIIDKVLADYKEDKKLSTDAWQEITNVLKSKWKDVEKQIKKELKK